MPILCKCCESEIEFEKEVCYIGFGDVNLFCSEECREHWVQHKRRINS